MKRTALKRRTPLRAKTPIKRSSRRLLPTAKLPNKGYKPPQWFNAIKPGSHGNTPAQKRYWRVVSETLRQEQWEESPHCRGCGVYFAHWNQGQAGHYKAFGACSSWFKFDKRNLCLICPGCNTKDDGPINFRMGVYLEDKYGEGHTDWIETENAKYRGQKMEVWEIVEKVAEMAPWLVH